MRRTLTTLLVLLSLSLAPPMAFAQTREAPLTQVVRQLEAQGYQITSTNRTLLGRVRVISRRGDREREVVFNPRNGNVLRDFVRILSDGGDGSNFATTSASDDRDLEEIEDAGDDGDGHDDEEDDEDDHDGDDEDHEDDDEDHDEDEEEEDEDDDDDDDDDDEDDEDEDEDD